MNAMSKLKKYDHVPVAEIKIGKRERGEVGDITGLAIDMKLNGLIHPIVVDQDYNLIVGYRRLLAAQQNQWESIRCQILDNPTELDIKEVMLSENLHRLNIAWHEELEIRNQIAQLKFGDNWKSKMDKQGGVTLNDLSEQVFDGAPISSISNDLRIAEAIKQIPSMKSLQNKGDVLKILKGVAKKHNVEQKAKEIESKPVEVRKKEVIDAYKVGNFFDLINTVPDESVTCINFDPDWGIEILGKKALTPANAVLAKMQYTEVKSADFAVFLKKALPLCYTKLKPNGWLLHWYDIKIHETIANLTEEAGFTIGLRIPALWLKLTGQTEKPDVYFPRSYEPFFYARKGQARLLKSRANDTFEYPNAPNKWHPAMKPVELMTDILSCFITPGDFMLDAFTGSGNALLAASNLGCQSIGFDLSKDNRSHFVVHANSQEPGSYKSYNIMVEDTNAKPE